MKDWKSEVKDLCGIPIGGDKPSEGITMEVTDMRAPGYKFPVLSACACSLIIFLVVPGVGFLLCLAY